MGITADYRQISEFEYASFKRSPLWLTDREYLRTHYEGLQQFYASAEQKGNGMLLSLT